MCSIAAVCEASTVPTTREPVLAIAIAWLRHTGHIPASSQMNEARQPNKRARSDAAECTQETTPSHSEHSRLADCARRIAPEAKSSRKKELSIHSLKDRVYLEDVNQLVELAEYIGATDVGVCSKEGLVTVTCVLPPQGRSVDSINSAKRACVVSDAQIESSTSTEAFRKMEKVVERDKKKLPDLLREKVARVIDSTISLLRDQEGDSTVDSLVIEPNSEMESNPSVLQSILFSFRLKPGERIRTCDLQRCFLRLEDGILCGDQDDDVNSKLHIPDTPVNSFLRKEQSQTCLTVHKNIMLTPNGQ
jgi:hypothetical protein